MFVNVVSQIDFNVYEYLSSSVDKTLEFLAEISSITLVSRERDLLQNSQRRLF